MLTTIRYTYKYIPTSFTYTVYKAKELQHNEFGTNNGIELTDFTNRTYDQQTGRFLQPDLLSQLRSGISPFNYCQNNPINRVDPTGNLDTDYKDENGNLIKHTDDKINRTVTVKNEDRSRFDIYTKTGEDKGIQQQKLQRLDDIKTARTGEYRECWSGY